MSPGPNLGKSSILVFSRTAATTSRPKKGPKPKKDVPLFDVPKIVLDLDAENSPYVRPYDETIEAEETARWRGAHASIDALTDRLAAFEEEADQADARMKAVAGDVLSPWRVQDRDVLSTALMADKARTWAFGREKSESEKAEKKRKQQLRGQAQEVALLGELFHQNGITHRATAEPATAVQFLLHRQRFASKQWKSASATAKSELQSALARCQSFTEIRRLLSLATQTAAGCTTVAACAGMIDARIRPTLYAASTDEKKTATAAASSTSSGHVAAPLSTMLLNLSHNFADKGGLKLGHKLCGLGLCAAAATMEPAAMRRFLAIGLSEGYFSATTRASPGPGARPEDDGSMPDITAALLAMRASLKRSHQQPTSYRAARSELFTLLTGHGLLPPTNVDLASSSPLSFRAALSPLPRSAATIGAHAWQQYFGVLAELGAVRTLWKEIQFMRSHDPGFRADTMIDAETLVTAVRRYGRFTDATTVSLEIQKTTGTRQRCDKASGTRRTDSIGNALPAGQKNDDSCTAAAAAVAAAQQESGSLADLRAIAAYEKHLQSRNTSHQPYAMLPTVRSTITTPPQPAAPVKLDGKGDREERFKAVVVAAFAKETERDMLGAIGAGLALEGSTDFLAHI